MRVLHIAMECYPAAKTGGLGDVVGALPKYLSAAGVLSAVVMPYYDRPWIRSKEMELQYAGDLDLDGEWIHFEILKMKEDLLGFPLYFAQIPGKVDRPEPYGYHDDHRRQMSFQRAVLDWLLDFKELPDVIHCHDHHTGFIPFMMQFCHKYEPLRSLPSVYTIHNAAYQGALTRDQIRLFPFFDAYHLGMMEWANALNPMASAVKCSWKVTTVSPSYMESLRINGHGLEWLFNNERGKCLGILNGIDNEVWDPASDPYLKYHLKKDQNAFKRNNKKFVCENLDLDPTLPLFVFIGRLAYEKGADFLPGALRAYMRHNSPVQFVMLGSGDSAIEWEFKSMEHEFPKTVRCFVEYNEHLAHQLYASADFLLMPSRVEPCGLNQMYAMRYGTVPIVRAVGGLIDSVIPLEGDSGNGYLFLDLEDIQLMYALHAAENLFQDKKRHREVRKRNMERNFSWEESAGRYIEVYESIAK